MMSRLTNRILKKFAPLQKKLNLTKNVSIKEIVPEKVTATIDGMFTLQVVIFLYRYHFCNYRDMLLQFPQVQCRFSHTVQYLQCLKPIH